MKTTFFTFAFLILSCGLFGQNKVVITTESGADLGSVTPTSYQYIFPTFKEGKVFYTNGKGGKGNMNYNMLIGEMQFISPDDNSVQALADIKSVYRIEIDGRIFYPYKQKEFMEELVAGDIKLCVLRKGKAVPYSKEGGYGVSTATSSIESINQTVNTASQGNPLAIKENILVTLKNYYYLLLPSGKVVQVKKVEDVKKVFPKIPKEIDAFVKSNKSNFDNEQDLKSLIQYCQGQELGE